MTGFEERQLAGSIDHTLLKATATHDQITQLCREAKNYGFYSVCVNPRWTNSAAEELADSKIKVGSVVSFPLGADSTGIKALQAGHLVDSGADEIDMVADLAAIIQRDKQYLLDQFNAILEICRSARPAVILKVIIESAALDRDEKIFACQIIDKCGVDFIKTSTGLHPAGGATAEDIKLIKKVAPNCKIKAAGGIRTYSQALEMLTAGAERIGTSSGLQIIKEFRAGQLQ